MPHWLWTPAADFPLFVSHRSLSRCKTLRPSTHGWALDSGGFTELSTFGGWRTSPREYTAAVARYDREIGQLEWAAPQDWMCEPWIINGGNGAPGTGLSVEEHQARTVANYLQLAALWPQYSDTECPFMPVLQGRPGDPDSYLACAARYEQAGVRLFESPVVGVGSVCRIQATSGATLIAEALGGIGLGPAARDGDGYPPSLHWFGLKLDGIARVYPNLGTCDSLAWSYSARREPKLPGCTHRAQACANCLTYATRWRERVLGRIDAAKTNGHQASLFGAAA